MSGSSRSGKFRLGFALALAGMVFSAVAVSAQDDEGKVLYDKYCSQCHGDDGDGLGVAAPFLKPAPRDFTTGKYKIRRTPSGYLPLDEDLERVIKVGLPYTAMPGFQNALNDSQVKSVVAYLKTFSADFEDPEAAGEPFEIPTPPAYTPESVERGAQLYVETGCGRCHGEIGYGDGGSAPTLTDDWGIHIRAADLSMPWTFRGGGTREDIFRTMSAGFNGTPMPGFHGALPTEDIWGIVDYIVSLGGGTSEGTPEASYASLLTSKATEDTLDIALGAELFAEATEARFPIVGQIIEPGRNFFPATTDVRVKAVHNNDEIAFMVKWHDMRAETIGSNGPDLQAPQWLDHLAEIDWSTVPGGQPGSLAADAGDEGGDVWGDAAGDDDPWGDAAADEDEDEDPWGDAAADEDEDPWGDAAADDDEDLWGDAAADDADDGSGGDFWGDEEGDAPVAGPTLAAGPDTEFNDAIAIQIPLTAPTGVRKPYFLFGDAQNAVDLWFLDLGTENATHYTGRGSTALAPAEGGDRLDISKSYDNGVWTVIFKRQRVSRLSMSFDEESFVPIAFSVWDGFNRERGNKRGLSRWFSVYVEPLEKPDPMGPMLKAGLGVLGLELLVIFLMRRRFGKKS